MSFDSDMHAAFRRRAQNSLFLIPLPLLLLHLLLAIVAVISVEAVEVGQAYDMKAGYRISTAGWRDLSSSRV